MSSWKIELDEVEGFFENHERRPSNKSKNVNEKTLAHWMETQLENRANNQYSMASAEIRDVWDAFRTKYMEYFRSKAEIWYGNLEEVRLFIEKNQKRPYERSKIKKENELGKWILCQLKNRLKNRRNMVREEIRDIWDAFDKMLKKTLRIWSLTINHVQEKERQIMASAQIRARNSIFGTIPFLKIV